MRTELTVGLMKVSCYRRDPGLSPLFLYSGCSQSEGCVQGVQEGEAAELRLSLWRAMVIHGPPSAGDRVALSSACSHLLCLTLPHLHLALSKYHPTPV